MSIMRRPSSPARRRSLAISPSCFASISSRCGRTSCRTKSSAVLAYSRSSLVKSAPVNCGVEPSGLTSQLAPPPLARPLASPCSPAGTVGLLMQRALRELALGFSQYASAEPSGVDAQGLADVLEAEHVAPVIRGEPRERFTSEIEPASVRRPGVLQERPDAILEHREQESTLAACRLGASIHGFVAHTDFAVEPRQVDDRVARMTEGRSSTRGRRGRARNRGLWNRMLPGLARDGGYRPPCSRRWHWSGHCPRTLRWQSAKSSIFHTKRAGEISAKLHFLEVGSDGQGGVRELPDALERDTRS